MLEARRAVVDRSLRRLRSVASAAFPSAVASPLAGLGAPPSAASSSRLPALVAPSARRDAIGANGELVVNICGM